MLRRPFFVIESGSFLLKIWKFARNRAKLATRSLSDLGNRSEGKLFLVRFVDHLRRVVSLFNENDRGI